MCQSMGGVHSLEVVLGYLVFENAAYLGTVMWCERFKCSNAKEKQFGDKEHGTLREW